MTEVDIAWAAGLYEGEGYCGVWNRRGNPRLGLGMTDLAVVERFRDIVGFGSIYATGKVRARPMYRCETASWDKIAWFRETLGEHLSARRLEQIDATLAKRRPPRPESPPCEQPGTAGYRRHLRKGEPPCGPCREANRDYERQRKGQTPRYPDGGGYSIFGYGER